MTIKEYQKRIKDLERQIIDTKGFYQEVAFNINQRADRIFIKGGVGSQGTSVSYTGGAMYKNPKVAPRSFPTKGKNGESKFKNGKNHKTGYFDSYKSYKRTIGQKGFVNLIEFGNFEKAFRTGIYPQGLKINHAIPLSVANPSGKVEGIIDRYPGVEYVSRKERKELNEGMQQVFLATLKKYL
jgi:hypothetical protein